MMCVDYLRRVRLLRRDPLRLIIKSRTPRFDGDDAVVSISREARMSSRWATGGLLFSLAHITISYGAAHAYGRRTREEIGIPCLSNQLSLSLDSGNRPFQLSSILSDNVYCIACKESSNAVELCSM